MLVDFHCHTKKVKKGESEKRNVTPEVFKSKIENADVKIVAITNHNQFDLKQFEILSNEVKDICLVWPGIEIDVQCKENKEKYHLIVICNPDETIEFNNAIHKLFDDKNVDTVLYGLNDICEKLKGLDVIYIPHYHNKRPAISEQERIMLQDLVGDPARVFIEPRDHKTLGVLVRNDFNAIIGSDVQDWEDYEKCTFSDLRLNVGSFSELLLLSKRDSSVVKSLLNQKAPLSIIGKPHPSVSLDLTLYPDINIIFGQKGTGKTELIKSLHSEMAKNGRRCQKYIAAERSDDFSMLLSTSGMHVDLSIINADSCKEYFEAIRNWNEIIPVSLSKYFDWGNTKNNSTNKSRMKITEAFHIESSTNPQVIKHKNDKIVVSDIINKISKIDTTYYIGKDKSNELKVLLQELLDSITQIRKDDIVLLEAERLTNYSIDKIKAIADLKSDTVSRPSSTGLIDFINNRLNLKKAVDAILESLLIEEVNERILLGYLEDKGKIYINTKYRLLSNDSKAEEFKGIGIRKLKEIKRKLEEISDRAFSANVVESVNDFNALCEENNITTIDCFLGVSKQIVTDGNIQYEPSNGEKGILLLQKVLNEDADAYFLDEPELGMGNSYIDAYIRPLLSKLAKQRKYVVIATHNANIAVRTLPYMSIFRAHENGEYKTYIGNPFDDRLVNLQDNNDVRRWTDESIRFLEGSREAFYERKDIYESNGN